MSDLKKIKELLEKYNKIPKKSLGQNFIINPEIPRKTAEVSLGNNSNNSNIINAGVLEIGPGFGALTEELCRLYKKVVSVEIDRTFEPVLNGMQNDFDNLKIIFGDILKIDLNGLIKKEFQEVNVNKINVCANLPYYITTPVVLKLVKNSVKLSGITVMIQTEAADKLCSKAGDKEYNVAAAIISYYGEAKKMFDVPRSNFYPAPKVMSTVVRITRHDVPIANPKSEDLMFRVIEAAFGQRRKTLVNALVSGLNLNLEREKVIDIVKKAAGEKNANIRGEELNIRMFSGISDLIYDIYSK